MVRSILFTQKFKMKRIRFFVSGKVQGICYRYYSANKAQELGLKGFVRNIPNGKVEVVVEGPEEQVEVFMNYCKNNPGYSRVERIEVMEEKEVEKPLFSDFKIKY